MSDVLPKAARDDVGGPREHFLRQTGCWQQIFNISEGGVSGFRGGTRFPAVSRPLNTLLVLGSGKFGSLPEIFVDSACGLAGVRYPAGVPILLSQHGAAMRRCSSK